MYCLATGPKGKSQPAFNWNLQTYEPKWTFLLISYLKNFVTVMESWLTHSIKQNSVMMDFSYSVALNTYFSPSTHPPLFFLPLLCTIYSLCSWLHIAVWDGFDLMLCMALNFISPRWKEVTLFSCWSSITFILFNKWTFLPGFFHQEKLVILSNWDNLLGNFLKNNLLT
jgi:hypothetical protein